MQPNKYTWLWSILIGFSLTVVASAEIKVGENFPDLAGCKLEGALPTLPKDSVILVDFWASWCGPCLRSFPAMEELSKAYASKGLIIVAVNVDEKKGDMENFLRDHHVSFAVVRDARQKLVERAGVETMPSSFLIDKNGKVAFVHSGFHGADTKKQYEREIESLLK